MKRLEEESRQMMLRREYSYMLDGVDDEEEECGYRAGQGKKKRRLSVEQVKALEKSFEVENKVETERKEKLAQQLGLEPRQVAVWFQNRRARWKTKVLEKDYASLHSQFQLLKHNYDSLLHDKHSLLSKIKHLKSKLSEDNNTKSGVKEEVVMDINTKDGIQTSLSVLEYEYDDDSKASESDSSAILNENDNNNNNNNNNNISSNASNNSSSSGGEFVENGEEQLIWMSPNSPSLRLNSSSSCLSAGYTTEFWASESNVCSSSHIVVKLEEQDHMYVNGEEACNLFSDDEVPPTQHWYTPGPPPDHWTLDA